MSSYDIIYEILIVALDLDCEFARNPDFLKKMIDKLLK